MTVFFVEIREAWNVGLRRGGKKASQGADWLHERLRFVREFTFLLVSR